MKILYVTTVGSTMNFFNSFIKDLLNEGHIVDVATNEDISAVPACYREWGCTIHHIDTSRSPLSRGNIVAIKQIRTIVETSHYDIVHCHTPLAAMCTRFACRKARKAGTKVIYTAHGFHFYKGAPLKNWLFYYPVEKMCAGLTDVLITINQEDYSFARNNLRAGRVIYVPGVGIDLERFGKTAVDRPAKRIELGIPEDATLLLSIGELNENKNHKTVIRAIADLNVYYIIAGKGTLHNALNDAIDSLNLSKRVQLLGYRSDILELCGTADIFVFPSFREGLPVSVMEAMASGLPCIASKIRGNTDLVIEGKGGFLCAPSDVEGFADAIETLASDPQLCRKMGLFNRNKVKDFNVTAVTEELKRIYTEVLG